MANKAKKIVDEIVDKVKDYETNMGSFLTNINEWGDLVRVTRPTRKNNAFSNPRLTEMARAANTLGTTVYRMMTAQDPFFDTVPMNPLDGNDRLLTIQGALETQLEESEYRRYLLQAVTSGIVFGTVVVQEDYKVIGTDALGGILPITTFKPRSMLQVAFDRGCTDLADADWFSTIDLISECGIRNLGTQPDWNKKALEEAAKAEETANDLAPEIIKRLIKYGYLNGGKMERKELLCYYGKLDALEDGVDYIAAVINRKYLVKFKANDNQWGRNKFRIATWISDPLCTEPRGIGLGDQLGALHKSMDANRQKIQDNLTMSAYGMWQRLRSAGIDDNDLKIRPMQIVDMDERDGLSPLKVEIQGAISGLKLEELMKQEFRTTSGASESLQAMVTGATASEVSLAQNEAMRTISVRAEILAESLVRQHLKIMHGNNANYCKTQFSINKYLGPQTVYPKDLETNVNFKLKMTTDKDYKPKRIETLVQTLQILTSTKSQHPQLQKIPILQVVGELLRALGVPADRSLSEAEQAPISMPQIPGMPGNQPMPGIPAEQMNPAMQTVNTPVGPTLASQTQ